MEAGKCDYKITGLEVFAPYHKIPIIKPIRYIGYSQPGDVAEPLLVFAYRICYLLIFPGDKLPVACLFNPEYSS